MVKKPFVDDELCAEPRGAAAEDLATCRARGLAGPEGPRHLQGARPNPESCRCQSASCPAGPRALQVAWSFWSSLTPRPAGGVVLSSCTPRLLTQLLVAEFVGPTDQRERDRERAQARAAHKGKNSKVDGLTPEQRRERDAKALQEKAARKAAAGDGNTGSKIKK
ncbi:hypothetical protein V6N13_131775 [Hibiscus sabdariffa]